MSFFHSRLARQNILLAFIGLGLWSNPSIAQEAPHAPVVTVVAATEAEMIDQVPISGTLVPRNEVLIYP